MEIDKKIKDYREYREAMNAIKNYKKKLHYNYKLTNAFIKKTSIFSSAAFAASMVLYNVYKRQGVADKYIDQAFDRGYFDTIMHTTGTSNRAELESFIDSIEYHSFFDDVIIDPNLWSAYYQYNSLVDFFAEQAKDAVPLVNETLCLGVAAIAALGLSGYMWNKGKKESFSHITCDSMDNKVASYYKNSTNEKYKEKVFQKYSKEFSNAKFFRGLARYEINEGKKRASQTPKQAEQCEQVK